MSHWTESPMKKCQFRPWDELPQELIQGVASRLIVYRDYIRLRAVCVSWRYTLPRFPNNNILRPQLPWLMLSCSSSAKEEDRKEEDHNSAELSFFDVTENKFYLLNLPAECNGKRVCGSGASSLGWLLMMGENEGPKVVNLFNPFTKILIPLPPLTTLPQHIELIVDEEEQVDHFAVFVGECDQRYCSLRDAHKFFIAKMVLSTSPSEEENGGDYMVVAILCFGGLAFMKKGDTTWSLYFDYFFNIKDITYHKGQLYVLSSSGRLGVLDFNSNGTNDSPPRMTMILYSGNLIHGDAKYLVEDSSGSLLIVTRHIRYLRKGHEVTRSFNVFKLEQTGLEQDEWLCNQVTSIGGDTLFLGPNSSVCLSFEEGLIHGGYQRNCIYFSDTPDTWVFPSTSRFHDIGVFDLEDGSIKPLLLHEQHPKFCLNHQIPTWVTPNPRSN